MLPDHMERTMKKILSVLAGVGLLMAFAMPADASWNVRQKGSGATVWTDGSVEVPVGDTGLVVPISNFANTATHFVVSHKAGLVKKIYVVTNNAFPTGSASPTLTFGYSGGTVAYFTPISATGTLTVTTAAFAGRSSSIAPTNTNSRISQGDVISIAVSGASVSSGASGNVVIIVE